MSDQTKTTRTGLLAAEGSDGVPVPLAGVSIDADIRSVYAKVVVAHRYVNRETTPIEAVYVFPLEEGAAVCGFEAIVDGTLVIGEIQEREKAFEIYDDAMEQGHGAFLLDEERPDVFQASIGNLPPGKEVLVKLTYVTELAVTDRHLRFMIPTTVSPRYAPAADRAGTGRPDSEALNPPVAWTVPYGLNLSVRLAMPGRISSIESPSHPISLSLGEGEATVTLAQQEAALDRDFVLSIDAAGLDMPTALVERDEDGTEAVAVTFAPAFATSSAPAELIFVVDRSGSMGGTSLEEVRNALQLCLRSMIPGCRFNIVGFGSTHETLFAGSQLYDQTSLEAASAHIARMRADLGGTEILPALQLVLEQAQDPELPRQIVILTDGQVTNTDEVIALVTRHARTARIFTFGIGAGASHHLVRGLARAGGGSAEFIHPGERIEPKVLRQFARLLSPAMTDVRVEWSGGAVTQAPVDVPAVFAGDRVMVYGFVKSGRPTKALLTATSCSGPLAFNASIEHTTVASGRIVATLAARARIRELEERGEWSRGRGSQQAGRKTDAVRSEIIALSTRYGLVSRETSFVAVERRDTPVVGDVKLRKVPIALTTGWGGLQYSMRFGRGDMVGGMVSKELLSGAAALAAARGRGGFTGALRTFGKADSPRPSAGRTEYQEPALVAPARPERSTRHGVPPDGMQTLIMLQAADGSWDLTPELASIIGHDIADLAAAVEGASGPPNEVRRAWATALALAWLRQHARAVEEEWRLLGAKARQWLDDIGVAPAGGWTWVDAARRFLNA